MLSTRNRRIKGPEKKEKEAEQMRPNKGPFREQVRTQLPKRVLRGHAALHNGG